MDKSRIPGGGSPSLERLLKTFPGVFCFALGLYVLVLDEAGRGSHPDLSTLNGAWDGLVSAGSTGRREWLERRRWASPASPNHLQRGGG